MKSLLISIFYVATLFGSLGLPYVVLKQMFGCNDTKFGHVSAILEKDVFRCDVYVSFHQNKFGILRDEKCDNVTLGEKVLVGYNRYWNLCFEIYDDSYVLFFSDTFNKIYIGVVLLCITCIMFREYKYEYDIERAQKNKYILQ